MKDKPRKLRDADKEKARIDEEFVSAAFDLEDLLQTPKGSAKGFYRRRKLNNYNLSIYDYGTSQGINNIWNESIAGRGSNEVGSCLYRFIEEKALRGSKVFSFYSDACGGQNRNRHILSLLWFVLRKFNLTEIRHTFFVSGHSQNEVDNVHSRIEQESNPIDIFTTAQWAGCIRNARRKPPRFQVNELDLDDFYNIKDISQNIKFLRLIQIIKRSSG